MVFESCCSVLFDSKATSASSPELVDIPALYQPAVQPRKYRAQKIVFKTSFNNECLIYCKYAWQTLNTSMVEMFGCGVNTVSVNHFDVISLDSTTPSQRHTVVFCLFCLDRQTLN
ncbi:hypothetical protein J6590_063222 [Homalodisca vitripennis]|nr:hypothetical protein J6590_063222 [Homalodisca vitripennis]